MKATPKAEGFRMPAEFAPHKGCILIWPERPGSWPYGAKAARQAFCKVIAAIAESETVYLCASPEAMPSAKKMVGDMENVVLFEGETNDAWARDVAPTFVKNEKGEVRAIDWQFNAWGGEYNGLYPDWEKDDAFDSFFCKTFGYDLYNAHPFVLEGGSIHSDGEGTILATESCLLSPGRNPELSKTQIEDMLKAYLGAEKILWIPRGIYNDETDEHVDNACAFIAPGEVVLAWTDHEDDPQYPLSLASLQALQNATDAKGRKLKIHKLPIPDTPVRVLEDDLKGYVFAEGEDNREVGERLAASYVNFYFSNDSVVMPAFGGIHEESDKRAQEILARLCPDRKIVPIYARDILLGGGNIHCITQQIPE